jgi:hypothetical protein
MHIDPRPLFVVVGIGAALLAVAAFSLGVLVGQ